MASVNTESNGHLEFSHFPHDLLSTNLRVRRVICVRKENNCNRSLQIRYESSYSLSHSVELFPVSTFQCLN